MHYSSLHYILGMVANFSDFILEIFEFTAEISKNNQFSNSRQSQNWSCVCWAVTPHHTEGLHGSKYYLHTIHCWSVWVTSYLLEVCGHVSPKLSVEVVTCHLTPQIFEYRIPELLVTVLLLVLYEMSFASYIYLTSDNYQFTDAFYFTMATLHTFGCSSFLIPTYENPRRCA